jgi:hypothetical protein
VNPFAELHNDTVFIENKNGERSVAYKTAVGATKGKLSAIIFVDSLDAEPGWRLFRKLPNGKEDAYTILESNYAPGMRGMLPPHWELTLRKNNSLVSARRPAAPSISISHSQGIQIGDHNSQHIAGSFIGLVEEIEQSAAGQEEKAAAKSLIRSVLENPIVASVLGSATAGVLALLS